MLQSINQFYSNNFEDEEPRQAAGCLVEPRPAPAPARPLVLVLAARPRPAHQHSAPAPAAQGGVPLAAPARGEAVGGEVRRVLRNVQPRPPASAEPAGAAAEVLAIPAI